jgi:hypothetical protein
MSKTPTPISVLTAGLNITVRIPIDNGGLKTLPNDAAVIDIVEARRSHLTFPRNGHTTWADNELLLNNVNQFIVRNDADAEPRLPFDYVTTWEAGEPLYLVVDLRGNEVARVISEDLAMQIAAALRAAIHPPEKVELSFDNGKTWDLHETVHSALCASSDFSSPAVFRGLYAGPGSTSIDGLKPF